MGFRGRPNLCAHVTRFRRGLRRGPWVMRPAQFMLFGQAERLFPTAHFTIAASGHAAAAPPSDVMNSHRLMGFPEDQSSRTKYNRSLGAGTELTCAASRMPAMRGMVSDRYRWIKDCHDRTGIHAARSHACPRKNALEQRRTIRRSYSPKQQDHFRRLE